MFHDPTVTTLQQLDNLHLKSPSDKSHVFAVISQNIPLLPKVSTVSSWETFHILKHFTLQKDQSRFVGVW
jgi:hypothetical protein